MTLPILLTPTSLESAVTATAASIASALNTTSPIGQAIYAFVSNTNCWIAQGIADTAIQSVSASGDTLTTATPHKLSTGMPVEVAALGDTAVSKAWQVSSVGVFVDITAPLNNATANDAQPFATGVIGDYCAIGFTSTFGPLKLNIGTAGTVGAMVWEYWNGTAWTALAGVTDNTTGLTVGGTHTVVFTVPSDWTASVINGSASLYYMRARVITTPFTINPLFTQGWVDGTLPTGLSASTPYFAIPVSLTMFKLATTYANALAGTAIDIITNNGGITATTVATAGAGSTYIPSGLMIPLDGFNGAKVSVIRDTADGAASITQCLMAR